MIRWATTFIIIAVISAVLGYGGMVGAASGLAKMFFFVFIMLYIISLLRVGVTR